jgi:hypothetical protein
MSLSPETLLELMALSDGELTGKDKEKAEILVNSNAQAREVVETMRAGHIGAWLKESLVSRAVAAGADAISDTVVSRLSVAGASDRVPPPDRVRRRQRLASARIVFGFVSGGLALAAAVLLYVGQRRSIVGQPRVADLPAAADSTPASARTPPGLVGQVASSEGIVVDEIDSPSHSISLFEIASAVEPRHPASVVIWIEDEQGAK